MKRKNPFKRLMENVYRSARSAGEKGQRYGRPEPLEVNIDEFYLEEIFNKQNGCCPYYKMIGVDRRLNMDLVYGTFTSLAPSVDRIDSTKGYIKGNIVITFRGINQLKQRNTMETFLKELKYLTFGNNSENQITNTVKSMENLTNSDTLRLAKEFMLSGEPKFALMAFDMMREHTKSLTEKTKSLTEIVTKSIDFSKYGKIKDRHERHREMRKDFIKPYDPYNKNLISVSEWLKIENPHSVINRGDDFWQKLVMSECMYTNSNGSISNFLVDIKRVPTNGIKINSK